MALSIDQVDECLGEAGALAEFFEQYHPRQEQLTMARAVAEAILERGDLLVEAGTGVGKTYAYLIPAILSEQRFVVSTGTKNLQDQLYKRDLPNLYKALGKSPKTALLKGRNNYLCSYRLESTLASGRLPNPQAVKDLTKVSRWREVTRTGDLSELSSIAEDSPVIPWVTSTADNCLGQDCPFIEECAVAKAREKARQAKVLVVNHHLLLADLVLKEDGFGELLPDPELFVIDEAHHLSQTAYQFYGDTTSSRVLLDLCRETELAYRTEATDCRDLLLKAQLCEKAVKDFRLALPQYDLKNDWLPNPQMAESALNLYLKINELFDVVKPNSSRSKNLESIFERLHQAKHLMMRFIQACRHDDLNRELVDTETQLLEEPEQAVARINWFETMKSGFRLSSTPLDIARLFQQSRARYEHCSWIMTSATLTVNDSFHHYQQTLGWHDCRTLELPSSFDYQNQALLYIPRGLPSPGQDRHTEQAIEQILPFIYQTGGRAFLLFTSHRALQKAAEFVSEIEGFNWLVQGESSKAAIMKSFLEKKASVLLATGSFWEGVDVPGDALVFVFIDKLPFSPPDDPLLNARAKALRNAGGNPFYDLQIPEAVLSLKQGVGRLIRSKQDKGVVCISDPRLVGKPYADIFINSLPPMRRTREAETVKSFLQQMMNQRTEAKDKTETC